MISLSTTLTKAAATTSSTVVPIEAAAATSTMCVPAMTASKESGTTAVAETTGVKGNGRKVMVSVNDGLDRRRHEKQ